MQSLLCNAEKSSVNGKWLSVMMSILGHAVCSCSDWSTVPVMTYSCRGLRNKPDVQDQTGSNQNGIRFVLQSQYPDEVCVIPVKVNWCVTHEK